MADILSYKLLENVYIPALGLGTWQVTGKDCVQAVKHAIAVGYRHIDTAFRYDNHREVAQAIKESNIPRDELFVTTKIWSDQFSTSEVYQAAQLALAELGVEYLDLVLMHWPNKNIPVDETLQALHHLRESGVIRAYGVSNFTIRHLQDALDAGYEVAVNQVEFHPSFNQKELKSFCDEHCILITAYSPIAQGEDLKLPIVQELSEKYQRSPSQVILNWILQSGMAVVPRSANPSHIEDNLQTLEWNLDLKDLELMNNLDSGNRIIMPEYHEFDYK
ncbi:MAG: aldo/keto reductase [Candidatus Dojkabacteria bacterium]